MTGLSELERDVEESRARLKSSLSQLEQRMGASSLADEVLGLINGTDGIRRSARALAVRHPVPLLMLGLGLSFAYWRSGRPPETWAQPRPCPPQMPNEALLEAEPEPENLGLPPPFHPASPTSSF
jgi:hypothetical protein